MQGARGRGSRGGRGPRPQRPPRAKPPPGSEPALPGVQTRDTADATTSYRPMGAALTMEEVRLLLLTVRVLTIEEVWSPYCQVAHD